MITSIHNKQVAAAVRLKKRAMREKDRLFLVEGAEGVAEALDSKAPVREVFAVPGSEGRLGGILTAARGLGVPVHPVAPAVMDHLTSTVTPQGIVAVCAFVDVRFEAVGREAASVPILVEVRDPGNAGTVLRSADASGAGAVVFTRGSVDVYNPKTVRATAGSLFHVPVSRDVDLEEAVDGLRARGFAVLAATPEGDASAYEADLSAPTAFLFGNEARGLPAEAEALADGSIRVPISGRAESLNLAAAAALVLFEAARQRALGRPSSGSPEPSGSLNQVVAGAAHDIRSPLVAIKGFSSTLLSRWDRMTDGQRRMMLEGIAHDALRMEVVISHLVDASRLSGGRLELAPEPTDLLEAALAMEAHLTRWDQDEELAVSGSHVRAWVDPARLRSMLIAMVESARWFAERGPVVVEVGEEPAPTVRVWREGSGLGQAEAEGLFVPRSPGTGGGSKIGLFVARGLATAMGGGLAAEAGERLVLTLTLPTVP